LQYAITTTLAAHLADDPRPKIDWAHRKHRFGGVGDLERDRIGVRPGMALAYG
jgi:hypothetical protein